MEVGGIIFFGEDEYRICRVLHRSMGSCGQRFVSARAKSVRRGRVFYVVERDCRTYWVKQCHDYPEGYSIKREFDESVRLSSTTSIAGNTISTVEMLAMSDDMLLMEYLDGYEKLSDICQRMSAEDRGALKSLLRLWIDEHDVRDYDMCANNTMVKVCGETMSVKLIDFEHSNGVNEERWNKFMESI